MAKSHISMTFVTASGKQSSISVQNPKDNLSDAEIKAVMNTIISSNSFMSSNGVFTAADSAKLVTTEEQDYSL